MITVKLTEKEAESLLFAAGNILDSGSREEVRDFFGDTQEQKAAYRATGKIRKALRGLRRSA